MHDPVAQSGALHMSFDIGKCVPKGAEGQRLVVGYPILVVQNLDERFHLRVPRIEVVGPLQERLNIAPHLGKEGGVSLGLAVVHFHCFEIIDSSPLEWTPQSVKLDFRQEVVSWHVNMIESSSWMPVLEAFTHRLHGIALRRRDTQSTPHRPA